MRLLWESLFIGISTSFETIIFSLTPSSPLTSPIITLIVGPEQRVFAAHEDVLSSCPYFCASMRNQLLKDGTKRVDLPDE